MDALVPAFIAALLCQATDRASWLTALLADRFGRPGMVALAALLVAATLSSLAAWGGSLLAPMLTPNARQLFLALALLMGGTSLLPLKAPDRLQGWRIGSFLTALIGLLVLGMGDRTQFFTIALAVRTPMPVFAAIGATAGACVIHTVAAYAGETLWRQLPLYPLRLGAGVLSLVAGAVLALGALRLI